MTLKELRTLLETTGFPIAYDHFDQKTNLPCIVYLRTDNDNIYADDKISEKRLNVDVILYVSKKQPETEEIIENLFIDNEINFEVSEHYYNDDKLYEITYSIQI